MEFVNLVIPSHMLNPVLDFLASINTDNKSVTPPASSAIEVQTIKFSAGDIQTTNKYCGEYSDEQYLINTLKNLGIKYSEVKKYCQLYPENISVAIERAGKPGTKRPVAMFLATLKNPGEIKSASAAIVTGDRLDIQQGVTGNIQPSAHQQAQLIQAKELVKEHKELIEYKANEWKSSKSFAHKDIEMVQADVIASYINDPVRFELDKVAFKTIQQRHQLQAEQEAEERQRLADIEKEVNAISQEQRHANLNRLRLALNKALFNSQQFARKKEEVEF